MPAEAVRTGIDMADLNDLNPLAKRLNAATDEFNQVLEAIQERLNALALGVEAWLDQSVHQELTREVDRTWAEHHGRQVENWPEDFNDEVILRRSVSVRELGYGRFGDGWALLVRTMTYHEAKDADGWSVVADEPAEERERKPLLRSARQLRVEAVDLIPNLIERLHYEASQVIDAVEKAKKIAESLK